MLSFVFVIMIMETRFLMGMGVRISVPHCSRLATMALFFQEAKTGSQ